MNVKSFTDMTWWRAKPKEPEQPSSEYATFLFRSSLLICISTFLMGFGIFCLWISGLTVTTQYGFSGAYESLGLIAFLFAIPSSLIGCGWFLISLYFITTEWMAGKIYKTIKMDKDACQVMLLILVPVILLFVTYWVGLHDPHSALCHGNPFGITCERMITVQESMGVTP